MTMDIHVIWVQVGIMCVDFFSGMKSKYLWGCSSFSFWNCILWRICEHLPLKALNLRWVYVPQCLILPSNITGSCGDSIDLNESIVNKIQENKKVEILIKNGRKLWGGVVRACQMIYVTTLGMHGEVRLSIALTDIQKYWKWHSSSISLVFEERNPHECSNFHLVVSQITTVCITVFTFFNSRVAQILQPPQHLPCLLMMNVVLNNHTNANNAKRYEE